MPECYEASAGAARARDSIRGGMDGVPGERGNRMAVEGADDVAVCVK